MSSTGHLDDIISAYLDDELTPAERADVDAHLAGCAECRSDLEAEREVRQLVRDLAPVDAPSGFYERILRAGPERREQPVKRRRIKFGLANIAATAAAWLLILAIAHFNNGNSVDPVPAGYVSAHASLVPGFGSKGPSPSAPTAESQEKAKSYDVPDRLAGSYQLVAIQEGGPYPQFIYTDGDRIVSMFVRPGRLNMDALPSDAEPIEVNGSMGVRVPSSDGDVVFLQRPGVVVILVGPAHDAAASDVAGTDGPRADDDESVLDHLTDAGQGLLETFGLRG